MSLARDGSRRVLRVRSIGRFRIGPGGREILCAPAGSADSGPFLRVLLDHVLPRALHLSGRAVLHGSAVAGPRGALVFLGPSGSGKSTLATLLAIRKWPLFADDGVRLEFRGGRVLAHPSHPLLRVRSPLRRSLPRSLREATLREPGNPEKWTLDGRKAPLRFAGRPLPVHRVFVLTRSNSKGYAIAPDPLALREAALALVDATFRADPWDLRAFARDVAVHGLVAAHASMRRLAVPCHPNSIPSRLANVLTE